MVSLTFTADESSVDAARNYAESQGTTLDRLMQDYLQQLAARRDRIQAATDFSRLARLHQTQAEPGWKFDREEIHRRDRLS